MYTLYIIQSLKDSSYYIGQTSNIEDRIKRHNERRNKFTKTKTPWKLVHTEEYKLRSEAVKREIEIKKKRSKKYIEFLIN